MFGVIVGAFHLHERRGKATVIGNVLDEELQTSESLSWHKVHFRFPGSKVAGCDDLVN